MKHGLRKTILSAVFIASAHSQVSREKEIALGQQLAAEIDSQQKNIANAEVTRYADRVLETLSRGESLRLPVKLNLVDSPELLASALPGGQLVLSSGAILRAESEAELAALLAHAMAHVQVGLLNKPSGPAGSGVPFVFLGGRWGMCARTADSVPMPVPGGLLAQSDLESQVDLLALGYLKNAGYDPQALVSVFDRWPGKFRPDEQVRSKALALRSNTASAVWNTSAFDHVRALLAPPAATPRQAPTLYR